MPHAELHEATRLPLVSQSVLTFARIGRTLLVLAVGAPASPDPEVERGANKRGRAAKSGRPPRSEETMEYTYKGVLHPSMESVVAEIVREMAIPIDRRPAHEVFTDAMDARVLAEINAEAGS